MKTPKPVLVAHRGDAAHHLENTLPAFSSAVELGIRHVELDIQLTRDGIPLVLHDANARRTHGLDIDVRMHTFSTLAQLGLFDSSRFDCPVPRFDEFVAWMQHHPAMHVFVEIKKESLRTQGRDKVLETVMETLAPIAGRHTLISYDARVLDMARQLDQPIGYVLPTMGNRYRAIAERLAPELVMADYKQILRAGSIWPGRWKWATFEVADTDIARRMIALGLDYLETMNPAALSSMALAVPAL